MISFHKVTELPVTPEANALYLLQVPDTTACTLFVTNQSGEYAKANSYPKHTVLATEGVWVGPYEQYAVHGDFILDGVIVLDEQAELRAE